MIYCVEDDRGIRELVVYTLESSGFKAVGVESGEQLFRELEKSRAALIILDIMLPGMDGMEILKRLKGDSSTRKIPVIMLTAKGTEYDRVLGLDSGADDYIPKPFGMMELVSRIKAVLRRCGESSDESVLTCKNVVLNRQSHTVFADGREAELTLKEFEVLSLLMKNAGTVMTRDMLLESVWGYDFDGETRTVDVHIRTLRAKLGSAGDIIQTVRGVGYKAVDG